MSQSLTIEQLKTYFRTNGVKDYSDKNKAQLLEMYNQSQKQQTNIISNPETKESVTSQLIPDLAELMSQYTEPEDYYKLMQSDPKIYTLEKYEPQVVETQRLKQKEQLESFEMGQKQTQDEEGDDFEYRESVEEKEIILKDNINDVLEIMEKLGMIEILDNIEIKNTLQVELRIKLLKPPQSIEYFRLYNKTPIGILNLKLPRSKYDKNLTALNFQLFQFRHTTKPYHYIIPETPLYKLLKDNMIALQTFIHSDENILF